MVSEEELETKPFQEPFEAQDVSNYPCKEQCKEYCQDGKIIGRIKGVKCVYIYMIYIYMYMIYVYI